jgi:hypothetical protein
MMSMRTPSSNTPKRALRLRDAGLRKISVTTRVLVVGSVAAAGAFASMAAWAQPGHTKVLRTATPNERPTARTGSATATVPATTPPTAAADDNRGDDGGGDDSNSAYLAPPATTPATAPATVPVQQDPGYQSSAPSNQYVPAPVVSGAS